MRVGAKRIQETFRPVCPWHGSRWSTLNDIGSLTLFQVLNSPHTYGSYWTFMSPQDPNFFTDFNKIPISMACRLREHPRFDEIAGMALRKLREDIYPIDFSNVTQRVKFGNRFQNPRSTMGLRRSLVITP